MLVSMPKACSYRQLIIARVVPALTHSASRRICASGLVFGLLTLQFLQLSAWAQVPGDRSDPIPVLTPLDESASPEPVPSRPAQPSSDETATPPGTASPVSDEAIPNRAPDPDRPLLTPQLLDTILGRSSGPVFDVYRLGPGDGIFVSVQRFPDLSFQATLDIQGRVIVPIEGAVSLEGLTLEEAEAKIRQIYDQYVINPDVTLSLTAQRPVQVTILGEIQRPGFYPLTAPQVSAALLTAGGSTQMADLRNIQIQRRLADGQVLETTLDLFTPLKEGDSIPDLRLENGDVVIIPRLDPSALDEYDRDLVARSTLAKPTITIRVLNYSAGGGRGGGTLNAVELPNGSRFVDAVTRLGIVLDAADLGQIGLVRFDQERGEATSTTLDARAAINGDPNNNPPLQDSDVIIVSRSLLAKITYALNTFTQPFRDVLGFLLFFDSLSDSASNLFRP